MEVQQQHAWWQLTGISLAQGHNHGEGAQPPLTNQNLKNTDVVDMIYSLHGLPFSWNQPLKLADD